MLDGPTVTSLSFFSKGHLFLIFVVLQIKIIHMYLSMSRTIDRVCYNPVEMFLVGTPHTPQKFLPFSPPTPEEFPFTIRGGGGGYGYFLESHSKGKSSKEVTSQLSIFSCWICQEELSSQELLLEHYDNYMRPG